MRGLRRNWEGPTSSRAVTVAETVIGPIGNRALPFAFEFFRSLFSRAPSKLFLCRVAFFPQPVPVVQ
jgi:hypothetical protein